MFDRLQWLIWNKKRVVEAGEHKLIKLIIAECWNVDRILKYELQSHLWFLEICEVPWKLLVFLVNCILIDELQIENIAVDVYCSISWYN